MPDIERDYGWDQPGRKLVAATKSNDTDDPAGISRAIHIGGDGDIKITTAGDTTVTLAVVAGVYPYMVKRVWDTGTDATGIFLVY